MSKALTNDEIAAQLAALQGWQRDDDTIYKTFQLETYLAGLAFASAVGAICEGLDHHPDMLIGWCKVTVSFTTHSAGDKLTARDFRAAHAIERIGYPKA